MSERARCPLCGPGYRYGDDGCRHTEPGPNAMTKVDQTIFVNDPERKGNCVAAAIATVLGRPLDQVPHFIEFGIAYGDSDDIGAASQGVHWWAMTMGYLAACGVWVEEIELEDAADDEVLLVAGMSSRGVMHQVVYRGRELWHDPHPSRDGLVDVREVLALRSVGPFDHAPTVSGPGSPAPVAATS